MFPSLTILDTLDRGGRDAYSNPIMILAVSRIPDNMFDKSHHRYLFQGLQLLLIKNKKKLTNALAKTVSIDSIGGKVISTK